MANDYWTAEKIARLTQLWAEGLTAALIADAMGGISRSSVLGKARQLNLPAREKASPGARSHRAEIERKKPAAPRIEPIAATPVTQKMVRGTKQCGDEAEGIRLLRSNAWAPLEGFEPVPLAARTGCCWPVDGPGGETLFCNAPRDGGSYCDPHHQISLPAERRAA